MPRRRGPDYDSGLKQWFIRRAVRSEQRREHLERELNRPHMTEETRAIRRRWSRNWFVLIIAAAGLAAWLLEVGPNGWHGPAIGVGMIVALGYVLNRFGPPV